MIDEEEKEKKSSRLKIGLTGALFILAFALYGGGNALVSSGQVPVGLTLMLANSVAVILIGVFLKPVIALTAPLTANIYLATRVAEGLMLGAGALVWTLADGAEWNTTLYHLAMIALGLGSIGFCRWLLSSRRIYAPHAWLGIVGYTCLVLAMVAGFIGLEFWSNVLLLPGAVFELSFGLYLLIVGMRPTT